MKLRVKILFLAWKFQIFLLNVTYLIFYFQKLIFKKQGSYKYDIVIGVTEVSSILHFLGQIPRSVTINLTLNKFYDYNYSLKLAQFTKNRLLLNCIRFFLGPIVLGILANHSKGVMYLWRDRFLLTCFDEGEYEYDFIKRKRMFLVFYFVGNDIRSPRLCMQLAYENHREVTSNYFDYSNNHRLTDEYEKIIRKRALVSERYADVIFNMDVDQRSYFTKKSIPNLYFFPKLQKSANLKINKKVLIVHAPSSPVVKGTQIIRACLNKLRLGGYEYEYVELKNVPHQEILKYLHKADIVINEMYGLVPGILAVEAMGRGCAVLTAADPEIELGLPRDEPLGWIVANPLTLERQLKILLEDKKLILKAKINGLRWYRQHCLADESAVKLQKILKDKNII